MHRTKGDWRQGPLLDSGTLRASPNLLVLLLLLRQAQNYRSVIRGFFQTPGHLIDLATLQPLDEIRTQ